MKIVFYKTVRNKELVREFVHSLEKKERAKILGCLRNIEDLGFYCPRVQFRQIKDKLWEIKIEAANSSYRVFYAAIRSDLLVLLHIYKKQSQKAPLKEIMIAKKRLAEVLNNEIYYSR